MHVFDRSGKWLIQHYGGSLLHLAGVTGFESWQPLQAELVQSRRLPDGLVEATFPGQSTPGLFLLELATLSEPRLTDQIVDEMMHVWIDRRVVPEAIAFILSSQGNNDPVSDWRAESAHALAAIGIRWTVVKLWEQPAEQLFQSGDVGLVPWIPLTDSDDPPETLFQRCRDLIEKVSNRNERINLAATTQLLAGLRYNEEKLFQILGGEEAVVEFPMVDKIVEKAVQKAVAERTAEIEKSVAERTAEARRKDVAMILARRFGGAPVELTDRLARVADDAALEDLLLGAIDCTDLAEFEQKLQTHIPESEGTS